MRVPWGRLVKEVARQSDLDGPERLIAVLRAAAMIEAMRLDLPSEQELPPLTAGELRSLRAYAETPNGGAAARALGVSEGTVRKNLRAIRGKYGVGRSAEAVAIAQRAGLLDPVEVAA